MAQNQQTIDLSNVSNDQINCNNNIPNSSNSDECECNDGNNINAVKQLYNSVKPISNNVIMSHINIMEDQIKTLKDEAKHLGKQFNNQLKQASIVFKHKLYNTYDGSNQCIDMIEINEDDDVIQHNICIDGDNKTIICREYDIRKLQISIAVHQHKLSVDKNKLKKIDSEINNCDVTLTLLSDDNKRVTDVNSELNSSLNDTFNELYKMAACKRNILTDEKECILKSINSVDNHIKEIKNNLDKSEANLEKFKYDMKQKYNEQIDKFFNKEKDTLNNKICKINDLIKEIERNIHQSKCDYNVSCVRKYNCNSVKDIYDNMYKLF